ncbi:MAG: hypothetical protein HZC28_17065 [Spirochaetes bacterium]|nr:hypothetical protein [Spirochaetota bacterium]
MVMVMLAARAYTENVPQSNQTGGGTIAPLTSRQNAIVIDPVGFINALVSYNVIDLTVEYQRALNDAFSLSFIPEFGFNSGLAGFSLGVGLNYHPFGQGIDGLYVSLLATGGVISTTFLYEIDAMCGWRMVFGNGIVVSAGAGFGYHSMMSLRYRLKIAEVGYAF